jgi:hypothetical protein
MPTPSTGAGANQAQQNSVWTKDEIELQIKKLENQMGVLQKRIKKDGTAQQEFKDLEEKFKSALDNYSQSNYVTTEETLIEVKNGLTEILNELSGGEQFAYFASIWGTVPISYGVAGLAVSIYLLICSFRVAMLGVPIWASLVAAMGASVQILVGVTQDYKADGMITEYKRLWYLVVIPVSLAFGFVAFILIQSGLITVSQGTLMINPINQTVTTATSAASSQIATINTVGLALPVLLCFLAGYATVWFMRLLSSLTQSTSQSGSTSK